MTFKNKQEIIDFCNAYDLKLVFRRGINCNSHKLVYESFGHFSVTIQETAINTYQIIMQLFSPYDNINVLVQ